MHKSRFLIIILAITVLLVQNAFAGVGGPVSLKNTRPTERDINHEQIRRILNTESMTASLKSMGFSAKDIEAHLAQLSDEELADFADDIEGVQAGGFGVWEVLMLLLVIYLIIKLSEMSTLHNGM